MKNKFLLNGYKGSNDWWRYFIVIAIVFVATQIGSLPFGFVATAKAMIAGVEVNSTNLTNFKLLGIDPNLGLFLMLLSFLAGLIALWFLVKPMHERTILDTITTRKRFDWNRFFFAVAIWGGIMIISFIIAYLQNPDDFVFQFKPKQFVILVFIVVVFLSLQSAFEEILFRGYFQQGLANLTKNTWIPLFFTSVTFGLMHGMNPEVKEFGMAIMIPQYITLGLFLGILAIMDDGLELSIGVHVANNVIGSLIATHESSVLQTSALFKLQTINPVESFYEIIITSVLFLVIMNYKYKWGSFKKLIARVKPEL